MILLQLLYGVVVMMLYDVIMLYEATLTCADASGQVAVSWHSPQCTHSLHDPTVALYGGPVFVIIRS